MRCKHENADHLMPGDTMPSFPWKWEREFAENPFGLSSAVKAKLDGIKPLVIVEQLRCLDCGHWLSLGASNDRGPHAAAVAIEVRAAELAYELSCADRLTEWTFRMVDHIDDGEWRGWSIAETNMQEHTAAWHAGYLARAIATHDTEEGET